MHDRKTEEDRRGRRTASYCKTPSPLQPRKILVDSISFRKMFLLYLFRLHCLWGHLFWAQCAHMHGWGGVDVKPDVYPHRTRRPREEPGCIYSFYSDGEMWKVTILGMQSPTLNCSIEINPVCCWSWESKQLKLWKLYILACLRHHLLRWRVWILSETNPCRWTWGFPRGRWKPILYGIRESLLLCGIPPLQDPASDGAYFHLLVAKNNLFNI